MRPISFGVSITPTVDPVNLQMATTADSLGLDLLAVQDHPYNPDHLEMWTFLTHLAARTSQISVMPDVADLALRRPALLAKAAATLDVLSGGRVSLAVGAGGIPDANAAFGGPRWSGAEALAATGEALQILRAGLQPSGSVRLHGTHHQALGYRPGPSPTKRIPLWVGGQGPRMLEMIGARADGWVSPLNIYVPPSDVPAARATIDRGAEQAGRDPADIQRISNVIGTIDRGSSGGAGLHGTAERWARTLADWTDRLGFDTFIFWPMTDEVEQLRRFAEDVMPRVRELAQAQSAAGTGGRTDG